jgi:hypothetical protein
MTHHVERILCTLHEKDLEQSKQDDRTTTRRSDDPTFQPPCIYASDIRDIISDTYREPPARALLFSLFSQLTHRHTRKVAGTTMSSPGPPEKKRGVRWNESNLAENEIVRAEIRQSCAKIDEPKTPYHHDDEDMTEGACDPSATNGDRRDRGDDADHSSGHTGREMLGALDASPGPTHGLKKRERDAKGGDAAGGNPSDAVEERPSNERRQPVSPPTDPRRGRTAFDEAIVAEEEEGREQELARTEKKKAFEEARRRHYGNAGLGMRLGNLLGKSRADDDGRADDAPDDDHDDTDRDERPKACAR